MNKLLIIEEDCLIMDRVKEKLIKDSWEVFSAHDGEQGLKMVTEIEPSLILLELILPKIGGLDVCQEVRKKYNMPIIIVTIKDSELEKVLSLGLGADDYVTKPFSTPELIARIRANLRRFQMNKLEEVNRGKKLSQVIPHFYLLKEE